MTQHVDEELMVALYRYNAWVVGLGTGARKMSANVGLRTTRG